MRILSFSPAATAWIAAFDGAGDLLPEVDPEGAAALRPDLVVLPAPSEGEVDPRWRAWLAEQGAGEGPAVFVLEGNTFKQVLDGALRLGRAAGRLPEAMAVLGAGERRLEALRLAVSRLRGASHAAPPRVACLDALAPLHAAGRWVPDLVGLAGGEEVVAGKGLPPHPLDEATLLAADPDVIAVLPVVPCSDVSDERLCGVAEWPGWSTLRAVRTGRVFLFDGPSFFHQPGPQLYRAVELLCAALYPEVAGGLGLAEGGTEWLVQAGRRP